METSSRHATRRVNLSLDLPAGLADQVEELNRSDPALLTRGIGYVMMRKQIFDVLATRPERPLLAHDR